MAEKKRLALITLGIALLAFMVASIEEFKGLGAPLSMNTTGFPSVGRGSAPIEVVLIEDFQCKNCRAFSQKVIPKLLEGYILSGKVRFTLVPVSFLRGSQIIANAALEINAQSPSQFFSFVDALLEHRNEVKKEDVLRFARRLNGINLAKLERCMEEGCHNKELEKNLDWARTVMGARFRTPALYINGAVGSTYSFEAIQYQIEQILEEK